MAPLHHWTHRVRSLPLGINARDPLTFAFVVTVVAVVACFAPAPGPTSVTLSWLSRVE